MHYFDFWCFYESNLWIFWKKKYNLFWNFINFLFFNLVSVACFIQQLCGNRGSKTYWKVNETFFVGSRRTPSFSEKPDRIPKLQIQFHQKCNWLNCFILLRITWKVGDLTAKVWMKKKDYCYKTDGFCIS